MCEAYFRLLAQNDPDLEAGSAGLAAPYMPAPAGSLAVQALAGLNSSIEKHRSRQFTPALAEEADLIIVFTHAHLKGIEHMVPEALPKTRLLMEYLRQENDVDDPSGGDWHVYEGCFADMKPAVEALYRKLKSKSK